MFFFSTLFRSSYPYEPTKSLPFVRPGETTVVKAHLQNDDTEASCFMTAREEMDCHPSIADLNAVSVTRKILVPSFFFSSFYSHHKWLSGEVNLYFIKVNWENKQKKNKERQKKVK